MAMVENYSKSEQNAYEKQELDKARLATIEQRMLAKMKDARSKPLPRRGDVKRRIAKHVKDALKGWVGTLKNIRRWSCA